MKLLLVFFILFLGVVFSKFKIKFNVKNFKFEIVLKQYVFSFIKILVIKVKNNELVINGIEFKLNIREFEVSKLYPIIINCIKNVKIKKARANIEYSLYDAKLTAEVYGLFCILINAILKNNILVEINPKFYNINLLNIESEIILKTNIIKVLLLILNNNFKKDNNKNKKENIKYERSTSYRSPYGNSYE